MSIQQYHPSIIVWSGNNENEAAIAQNWYGTNNDEKQYIDMYGQLYFDTVKSNVTSLDTSRPFISSSPSNGDETASNPVDQNPQDEFRGDVHYYNYLADCWVILIHYWKKWIHRSFPEISWFLRIILPWHIQCRCMDMHHGDDCLWWIRYRMPRCSIRYIYDAYRMDVRSHADCHQDTSTFVIPRFASEFGYQSFPSFLTLEPVSIKEDWEFNSKFMIHRQHHPDGQSQMMKQMWELFKHQFYKKKHNRINIILMILLYNLFLAEKNLGIITFWLHLDQIIWPTTKTPFIWLKSCKLCVIRGNLNIFNLINYQINKIRNEIIKESV